MISTLTVYSSPHDFLGHPMKSNTKTAKLIPQDQTIGKFCTNCSRFPKFESLCTLPTQK